MTRRRFLEIGAGSALAARLDEPARQAFRAWFTWLAEALYVRREPPAGIRDCAGLVRFAYREALRPHTAQWAAQWGFDRLPPLPEPHPAVLPLFRVQGGQYRHFADAGHLMRYNTRFVAPHVEAAQPADLLFYRDTGRNSWHVMVYLGRSRFENSRTRYVVYHTGPSGAWKGEVRRPALGDLMRHPEPRWRPVPGNANFLGVYRWNILVEAG